MKCVIRDCPRESVDRGLCHVHHRYYRVLHQNRCTCGRRLVGKAARNREMCKTCFSLTPEGRAEEAARWRRRNAARKAGATA